jgi:nicotinate phosphoribosyltransferase
MLDEAGHEKAYITASSDLDEYFISDLKAQGAKIDIWGVGTKMITAYDCPAFGGIYKLCAELEDRKIQPKIKISENPAKVSNPGVKKLYRLYDKSTSKLKADLITLDDEHFDDRKDITIFDPDATWKRMTLKKGFFGIRELLKLVYKDGSKVIKSPSCAEIREKCKGELEALWDEHRRLSNPHIYPVDLSEKLLALKKEMIDEHRKLVGRAHID